MPGALRQAANAHFTCLARLANVSVRFGDVSVFSRVSARFPRGEHTALVGPNGSGKSTLLRLLHGDLRPSDAGGERGKIYWNFSGRAETSVLSAREHARLVSPDQQREYARQGWNITGREIVLSGLGNTALVYGATTPREEALADGLARAADAAPLMNMPAPAMSQGQLRMALLLRALMGKPLLLLLDEPFDGLDAAARKHILACMAVAIRQGCTIVITAHREEDIPPFITAAIRIDNGRLRRIPVRGARAAVKAAAMKDPRPDDIPSGPVPAPPVVTLFKLDHVDVYRDRRQVLYDVSWQVHQGEQWLVSGPNGSGKSTLLRLLYGEDFAAAGGAMLWEGGKRPILQAFRKQVGYVSDQLQYDYDRDITVEDVVVSGIRGTIGLYGRSRKAERETARGWLERLGLRDAGKRNFQTLSTGMARRVLLARALAAAPRLLLLDEPASGLDAASRRFFFNALPRLARRGATLIYVSHRADEHPPLFTHELRLAQGRVVFAGKRA